MRVYALETLFKRSLASVLCLIVWHGATYGQSCDFRLTGNPPLAAPSFPEVPNTAQELDQFVKTNRSAYHIFPLISRLVLTDQKKVDVEGWNNDGTIEAKLDEKPVFIKVLMEGSGIHEAAWLTFLNRHGLGVKFLGLAVISNRWALVMDYAPGINTKQIYDRIPDEMPEIRRQIYKLFDLGVDPMDLQFLVHDGQAVLIDTGMFTSDAGDPEPVEEFIEEYIQKFYR